jgi:hypothetical protein
VIDMKIASRQMGEARLQPISAVRAWLTEQGFTCTLVRSDNGWCQFSVRMIRKAQGHDRPFTVFTAHTDPDFDLDSEPHPDGDYGFLTISLHDVKLTVFNTSGNNSYNMELTDPDCFDQLLEGMRKLAMQRGYMWDG